MFVFVLGQYSNGAGNDERINRLFQALRKFFQNIAATTFNSLTCIIIKNPSHILGSWIVDVAEYFFSAKIRG